MTLQQFKNILTGINGVSVYHKTAAKAANNYIVWAEVGKVRLSGNCKTSEAVYRYAVDFYTLAEYSATPETIERALEAGGCVITDLAIDYETDTKLTHYAYTVEG